jgi:hypothetical protein
MNAGETKHNWPDVFRKRVTYRCNKPINFCFMPVFAGLFVMFDIAKASRNPKQTSGSCFNLYMG